MIQILPRTNYTFNINNFIMFMKTLIKHNDRKSFLQIFKNPLHHKFIIDCDKDNNINFYMDSKNDFLINALTSFTGSDADAIIIEKNLQMNFIYNTIYLKSEEDKVASFIDDKIFFYIISSMERNTRIEIEFNVLEDVIVNKNEYKQDDIKLECCIYTSCLSKESFNSLKSLTNNICNLTASNNKFYVKYKKIFRPFKISCKEVSNKFQFPTLANKNDNEILKRISKLYGAEKTLKDDEFISGVCCGRLHHPIQIDRDVKINKNKLKQHGLITGATGSGKSSVMEEMIRSIIKNNLDNPKDAIGFTFTDPAESAVLGVIDIIDKFKYEGYDTDELMKKVHYIDLSNNDIIFPISLLNSKYDPTTIIDFFRSLYGEQTTVQVDRVLANCISSLIEDDEEHTLIDIMKVLSNEEYRLALANRLQSNIYLSEQVNFLMSKITQTQVDPILNRIDPFLNSKTKKLMFGMKEKHNALKDISKWMDEGHIILINLAGTTNFDVKVVVGFIALSYYLEALKRNEGERLHLFISDECHKTQLPIFEKISAETRKKSLGLFLMTQFLEQFDDNLLKALLNNVATKISFRQGETAANLLAKNVANSITKSELQILSDRVGFLSTEDNSEFKSIMIDVSPPYRYTEGRLVNYLDKNEVKFNTEKNRKIAIDIYKRDYYSKQEAEKIVFKLKDDDLDYENKLINDGFQLWDKS